MSYSSNRTESEASSEEDKSPFRRKATESKRRSFSEKFSSSFENIKTRFFVEEEIYNIGI